MLAWMARANGGWAKAVVFAAGLTAPSGAYAEAPHPAPVGASWLDWQGPTECQNTREVERQLESLLGRRPDPAQMPPTRVELDWAALRGWTLRIRVGLPNGERRREVDVRTCADGFDVVALTLALILDPELEAPELETVPLPDAGALDPTQARAEAVPEPLGEASGLPTSSPAAAGITPDPSSAAPVPELALAPIVPPPEPRSALVLAGTGRADLGSLPATLYGGGLELSLSLWPWRLSTGAGLLLRGSEPLPTALYPVSYSNWFGSAQACREFRGERGGQFGTCLGAQLGSVQAEEMGGERRRARGLWAALHLGAEFGVELTRSWGAFSRLELLFPLARHELALAGGGVVHEIPAVSVQLLVGASFRVTEWGRR